MKTNSFLEQKTFHLLRGFEMKGHGRNKEHMGQTRDEFFHLFWQLMEAIIQLATLTFFCLFCYSSLCTVRAAARTRTRPARSTSAPSCEKQTLRRRLRCESRRNRATEHHPGHQSRFSCRPHSSHRARWSMMTMSLTCKYD